MVPGRRRAAPRDGAGESSEGGPPVAGLGSGPASVPAPARVKQVWGGPPSGLERSGNFLVFTATPPLPPLRRGAASAASPERLTCEFGSDTYHFPPQVLVVCEHLFKSAGWTLVGKGSFRARILRSPALLRWSRGWRGGMAAVHLSLRLLT